MENKVEIKISKVEKTIDGVKQEPVYVVKKYVGDWATMEWFEVSEQSIIELAHKLLTMFPEIYMDEMENQGFKNGEKK